MKSAALDTKFVLALAGDEPDAWATLEYLRSRGIRPIVTESVVEQIGELFKIRFDSPIKDWILKAYWMIPAWGIVEAVNPYVQNGTSCVHAEKILEQGLIPDASQIEAQMLVEASCHGCDLLITFSEPLLKAPPTPLNLALIDNEMSAVTVAIASPKLIAERLRQSAPLTSAVEI